MGSGASSMREKMNYRLARGAYHRSGKEVKPFGDAPLVDEHRKPPGRCGPVLARTSG
jgi:hypothetical protein